jgi:hypothetical protein
VGCCRDAYRECACLHSFQHCSCLHIPVLIVREHQTPCTYPASSFHLTLSLISSSSQASSLAATYPHFALVPLAHLVLRFLGGVDRGLLLLFRHDWLGLLATGCLVCCVPVADGERWGRCAMMRPSVEQTAKRFWVLGPRGTQRHTEALLRLHHAAERSMCVRALPICPKPHLPFISIARASGFHRSKIDFSSHQPTPQHTTHAQAGSPSSPVK